MDRSGRGFSRGWCANDKQMSQEVYSGKIYSRIYSGLVGAVLEPVGPRPLQLSRPPSGRADPEGKNQKNVHAPKPGSDPSGSRGPPLIRPRRPLRPVRQCNHAIILKWKN